MLFYFTLTTDLEKEVITKDDLADKGFSPSGLYDRLLVKRSCGHKQHRKMVVGIRMMLLYLACFCSILWFQVFPFNESTTFELSTC